MRERDREREGGRGERESSGELRNGFDRNWILCKDIVQGPKCMYLYKCMVTYSSRLYIPYGVCKCQGGLSIPDVALDRDYKHILEAH